MRVELTKNKTQKYIQKNQTLYLFQPQSTITCQAITGVDGL